MKPEDAARQRIDAKLEAAGWLVQDAKVVNLGAGRGIAVREYPTDTGPADYLLLVDRTPIGVIEAKRDEEGHKLSAHEPQTARYANATLKWRKDAAPLRFLYESTGQILWFTDGDDPAPRARELFHFLRPDTLAEWATQPDTLRTRLQHLPPLPTRGWRRAVISARSCWRLAESLAALESLALRGESA